MLFPKIHDPKGEEESMGKTNHLHANHLKANVAKYYQIKIDFGIKSIIPDNPICYRITKRTIRQEILAIMNLHKMRLIIVLPPKRMILNKLTCQILRIVPGTQ